MTDHLIGLLTYASMNLSAFPDLLSGMLLRFSANTVAGQWRILTALPMNQMDTKLNEWETKVKSRWNLKFLNSKLCPILRSDARHKRRPSRKENPSGCCGPAG